MMSLRQVLAAHAPVLVMDASSALVQVGWLAKDEPARWTTSEAESGIGIFGCIESLGIDVGKARAFIFCDGPGSILGTRTVAMAIRTWCVLESRPIFAYSSLALVAAALGRPDAAVIVDARRDAWHCYQLGHGLRRVSAAELSSLPDLVTPEHFRHWAPLPARVSRSPYLLADLWAQQMEMELLRPTDAPDAFLHEEPSYATWTPQIHRPPSAK